MYLKQLYQQHKGWFLFVVLFIAGQLFINFKRGVVFSPFYHYGMYSEKMELPDSITVVRIKMHKGELQPFDFSAQAWDKLTLPWYLIRGLKEHDSICYYKDAKRILEKLHLPNNKINFKPQPFNFSNWYFPYAEKIIDNKADSIYYINLLKYPIEQFNSNSKSVSRTP